MRKLEEVKFDKGEFAKVLNRAKGKRSINEFANETGVSSAHISRLLRSLINVPPSPKTIQKLANRASNGVTYKEMMKCAGHFDPHNTIDIKDTYRGEIVTLIDKCQHLSGDQLELLIQIASNFVKVNHSEK